jgi:lysozyme
MRDTKAIEKARELIKEFEGLSLKPYFCPAGLKTIGYGHVIGKHDNITDDITIERAEDLLEEDILRADSCLYRNARSVDLNHNQRAALISFIFNLGGGVFQSSTLRQKLLRGEYFDAANEISRFVFAGGRKLPGLVRRRAAEKALFNTPVDLVEQKRLGFVIISYVKNIFRHVKAEV